METRTKRLERLDLHVLKKEGWGGKTRRGIVIFQRPVGYHTGSTELMCPQGHCNSHWVVTAKRVKKFCCQALEEAAGGLSVHGGF